MTGWVHDPTRHTLQMGTTRHREMPHSHSMATTLRRLTTIAAVLVVLAGCSGGPNPAPTSPAATTSRPAATTTTTAAAPAAAVSDGHWVAGPVPATLADSCCAQARQIPPGTYQTTTDVSEGCYWWLMPADAANPFDDARPGQAAEGRPTVTVEAGTWWQVWRCGTWARID